MVRVLLENIETQHLEVVAPYIDDDILRANFQEKTAGEFGELWQELDPSLASVVREALTRANSYQEQSGLFDGPRARIISLETSACILSALSDQIKRDRV